MDSTPPPRSERYTPRVNSLRIIWNVFVASVVVASLFTAYTPLGLIPYGLAERLSQAFGGVQESSPLVFPTATPRPRPRLGIVAGHYQNDSGAQCADGLTEADVNLEIATRIRQQLIDEGFDVDLLAEYDDRLTGYQALALVSIHADTCDFISNEATGYKVAPTLGTIYPEKADRLVACIRNRYEAVTGLQFHPGSITRDMTSYHAFDEIHNETTAVIIETGFLNLDRQLLTTGQDQVAEGIVNGILCYLYNEDASAAP
ncbi:MAG: N-acetylmuramoyl-L-alanine amidase [Anaerolineae bacterium]|nr:MAG: N-acetylmuramoyl-L-alanine amidase [Anaerolineae bacterium]